ncbi:MAG TPA: type II secretion system F family protein [Planctomycetaceae bacterium]|nr:type II secretion system F family protein [Planctomycetaceae bacterium]
MPDFRYSARELSGQAVTGVLTAGTEREALTQLSAKGLFPLNLQLAETAKAQQASKGKRVSGRLLATFYTQLADLLRSGVPLMRSLDILERQCRNITLKTVVQEVRAAVADGSRLAEAMRQHPTIFSDLTISIIRAGEEGSFMEDSLGRIAEFTEHQEELKGKVISAMAYPAFLVVIGSMVVMAMLVYFVPKFEPMFARMRETGQLPWATTALLTISNGLIDYGLLAGVVLVVGGVFAYRSVDWKAQRFRMDEIRLKLPGIGNLTRSLGVARFCRVLGTLLHNGVPLLTSLKIAKDATGNLVLAEAIGKASEEVTSGKSLSKPLMASGQFPPDVIEMVAVGEEANNLEHVLISVADKMERTSNRQLDMVVRLLEPAMLVLMAGIILFIVVALMLPIMNSSSSM